jgi:ABC-type transport system involved in multi-copper enzyme maturation permease subunit
MNAFVKKEIRLLLPVCVAVLVLEVALPWIGSEQGEGIMMAPVFFFFGMILLAVDSFGREFSLGTFSSLMSQPMERRQIWRTKITVLLLGAALIFVAYFVSCELRIHLMFTNKDTLAWRENQVYYFRHAMLASVAVLFVALAGGLWTTLLLRQISAAFWITFLTPVAILVTGTLCLPEKYADNGHVVTALLYGLAAIYTVAGFWLAHRLFHRAQDAAWTGGVISFSTWRYFSAGKQTSVSERRRRPLAALLKKEFQLQSISLFCVGTLLVLHLAVFLLRTTYVDSHKNSFAEGISDLFWTLWLIMPLIIGGTAVAEERKLGLAENQFCLPVARRTQFTVKFIPVMFFGTLLGGVMPMLLESLAAHAGAPCDIYRVNHYNVGQYGSAEFGFELGVVALAAGLSWVSFFASTLARNFLQALSISVVIIVGCCLLGSFGSNFFERRFSIFGILPWPSVPPILIGVPTLLVTLMWLVYRNFSYFHESWRLWRGNILGVVAALLFVSGSSAILYNRVWEVFEPAEPAHGPAKFSAANRPTLHTDVYRDLQVRLPDGRIWCDSLGYFFFFEHEYQPNRWKQLWWMLTDPRPKSAGPRQFIAGSNWISAITGKIEFWNSYPDGSGQNQLSGYLDTVGIQSNGTLWVSSHAMPEVWTGREMAQFGSETNWHQVIRNYQGVLLLKNDDTLWRWGTNRMDWSGWQTNWPSVRHYQTRQIGTNSDWQEISNAGYFNARKTDGSVWSVRMDSRIGIDELERHTNFARGPMQPFGLRESAAACVGTNGTVWVANLNRVENEGDQNQRPWEGTGYLQVGQETNWVAVAVCWGNNDNVLEKLVALKADGSLWKWKSVKKSTAEIANTPPTRLGIHSDWIGLVGTWDGAVALAADGSLWFWPGADHADQTLFKYPKQPKRLGNVFGKADYSSSWQHWDGRAHHSVRAVVANQNTFVDKRRRAEDCPPYPLLCQC